MIAFIESVAKHATLASLKSHGYLVKHGCEIVSAELMAEQIYKGNV